MKNENYEEEVSLSDYLFKETWTRYMFHPLDNRCVTFGLLWEVSSKPKCNIWGNPVLLEVTPTKTPPRKLPDKINFIAVKAGTLAIQSLQVETFHCGGTRLKRFMVTQVEKLTLSLP